MSRKNRKASTSRDAKKKEKPMETDTTDVDVDKIAASLDATASAETPESPETPEAVPAEVEVPVEAPIEPEAHIEEEVVPEQAPDVVPSAPSVVIGTPPMTVKPIDLEPPISNAVSMAMRRPGFRMAQLRRRPTGDKNIDAAVKLVNERKASAAAQGSPDVIKLNKLFDEYEAMCARIDKSNPHELLSATNKLYDIMVLCTPRSTSVDLTLCTELIRGVFRRLSVGYGTVYTDATLFRQDYNLPTARDAMKYDTFWHVMFQLVESAKTGSRISYNTINASKILNAPVPMHAITNIRTRIEEIRN